MWNVLMKQYKAMKSRFIWEWYTNEMFEDTKGVIRALKSEKARQFYQSHEICIGHYTFAIANFSNGQCGFLMF
jgi:hypothetical protein